MSTLDYSTPILLARSHEKDQLQGLNDRFSAYLSRVRQIREQSGRMESINLINNTKILEDEIIALKAMYERQLEDLRNQLEAMSKERTQYQLAASKNAALASEYQDKLAEEHSTRKKMENNYADAQRVIAEKEAQLHDARVTNTQEQNAHMDTKRDRDGIASALTQTQQALDTEAAARADLQTLANQLRDKINFQQELHDKEMHEMRCRLDDADRTILLAEQRLREHDIIDENLSAMLAKVKLNSEAELRRFKQESEFSYQNSMQQMKAQLDHETRNFASATEENIRLKASVEQLSSKLASVESRCAGLEEQNNTLIQNLELERQHSANTITNLEIKLREVQDALMSKVRELGLAYSSHIPCDLEIDSLATMLEAEERRLRLSLEKPPVGPIHTRSVISTSPVEIGTTKTTTNYPPRPASVPVPVTHVTQATRKPISRPKTTSGAISVNRLPNIQPVTTKSSHKHSWSYVPNFVDYHLPSSSHTGNVRILEVNPDGKFVRIFNTSSFQDEEIGGCMIQQNIGGRPVTVFRFPPRTTIKALSHATVWSASSLGRHNPPSDFLWKEQNKWGTGPECTTILCKPNGQAVAWTTAAYPFGIPNSIPTRDNEDEPVRDSQRSKSPRPKPKDPEMKPFAQPPTDNLHSHAVQPRMYKSGNDGMSNNTQSRSQTTKPDHKTAGAIRTGGAPMRKYQSLPNEKNGGGTIRVMPGSPFNSPSQQLRNGIDKINTHHKVDFQPPMPKTRVNMAPVY